MDVHFLATCQDHNSLKQKAGYDGENRHCTSAHLSSYVTFGVPVKDKLGLDMFVTTENDNKPLPYCSDNPDHASQITKLKPSPTSTPCNIH